MKRTAGLCVFVVLVGIAAFSQPQPLGEALANMKMFQGYFSFFWDDGTGRIWLEIDKFDKDFLYVSSLAAGLGSNDIGLDRNQLGATRIVRFERFGSKILLIQPNFSFRALSDNPAEREAVDDGFARSVIWGFQAVEAPGGRIVVDATSFFMQDAHGVAEALQRKNQGSYRVDLSRSVIYVARTKNFPKNTEVEAILTFTCDNPGRLVRQVAPDAGAITVRQHHSFIELPDGHYKTRIYDPRSNFSGISFMDFAAPVEEPLLKRLTCRHRLQKRNPEAAVSEPVEPIVYYVDNATPEPIRSALAEGALWWNEAFEAIGYTNAFQVKILPEGADPLDIRYNMINWIHRATRGWSYGSTVTDPRTGEIIKGHVALGSQRVRQDFLIASGLVAEYEQGKETDPRMLEMALARIRQLSAHEVGHTLGLGHNYASSVNDRASVMDYPHPLIKIKPDGTLDLSDAYDTGIGEWDKVSIAFGYQDFPAGTAEEIELNAILDSAFSRGLYFLASQDAGPGSAHPLANTWDNGKDPVEELNRVMEIRSIALRTFSEKRVPAGAPLATLEEFLVPVYMFHRYQTEAAASKLGGLYYNHTIRGDSQSPTRIVPAAEQRRALDSLLQTISAESLAFGKKILDLIPPRPPGYGRSSELFSGHTGDTFDPLGAAEAAAQHTVGLILHPERASRMVDYHSRDADMPGVGEVLDRLFEVTWKSDKKKGRLSEIQRVIDHVVLLNTMRLAVEEAAHPQVRAVALFKLDELKKWLSSRLDSIESEDQKAHVFAAVSRIQLFQENPQQFVFSPSLPAPPGAPIGMFD